MDFDLTSSHAHLSLLRPLTVQSAELAKVVETLRNAESTNLQDTTSIRTVINGSRKGRVVQGGKAC